MYKIGEPPVPYLIRTEHEVYPINMPGGDCHGKNCSGRQRWRWHFQKFINISLHDVRKIVSVLKIVKIVYINISSTLLWFCFYFKKILSKEGERLFGPSIIFK